jgi:hypothetical protein
MRYLRRFLAKCIGFVRNRHADAELDREIHAHLALLEDDYRQMGMNADESFFPMKTRSASASESTKMKIEVPMRSSVWWRTPSMPIRTRPRKQCSSSLSRNGSTA